MTTANEVKAGAAADPLRCMIAMPFDGEFYPNGFPARVRSNSPVVLAAAHEAWRGWQQRFREAPVEIRALVGGGSSSEAPQPPADSAQGHLLASVANRDNHYCCDMRQGLADVWVTEAVAASGDYFRYHFLEAPAYGLLEVFHLLSVHAACVSLDGRGVLLSGESGAGKSSLAYACARRGWAYCSDDASSLVRRAEGRIVLGRPGVFRFRESAGALFPEFRGMKESRRGNGKPTIEVRTQTLPAIRTATESRVDHIVFLNRRDAAGVLAQIECISKQEARRRLSWDPWPPELPFREERKAALERLLGAETYEMRYRDLDHAVDRLEQLVRGGSQ